MQSIRPPWSFPQKITITRWVYYQMRVHVLECLPEEACGLLAAGSDGRVKRHFGIENIKHSSSRFQLNPDKQVRAMLWMEKHSLELMLIYHSHPNGPGRLSDTDVAESYYPDALHLLWFPDGAIWKLKAFRIDSESSFEIQIVLV
jgi:[CysO sulfur-carrier protein]-S-L-cysteine hydrolase